MFDRIQTTKVKLGWRGSGKDRKSSLKNYHWLNFNYSMWVCDIQ